MYLINDPTLATQPTIQETAIAMLEALTKYEESMSIRVCNSLSIKHLPVDMNRILTRDIHRFNKGCLIFSSDPIATALTTYHNNFKNFIDATSDRDIFHQVKIDNILTKYKHECDVWKLNIQKIEKNKSRKNQKSQGVDNWQVVSDIVDRKPRFDFPRVLKICSLEHLEKSCVDINKHTNIECNGFVEPENLPEISTVSNEILTMLASGIGIYSTKNKMLDDEYLNTVLLLAKEGIIKFIFTDSSIAYGTNLATSDVIIVDEDVVKENGEIAPSITSQHSMKTLFQMMGRAGRGGNLSYKANIYTTSKNNNLINKINNYIFGDANDKNNDAHNEVNNIMRAYKILWGK